MACNCPTCRVLAATARARAADAAASIDSDPWSLANDEERDHIHAELEDARAEFRAAIRALAADLHVKL